jgi:hypothetical protein
MYRRIRSGIQAVFHQPGLGCAPEGTRNIGLARHLDEAHAITAEQIGDGIRIELRQANDIT